MPEVIMPKMGDAMEEGTLLKWLKSEGDDVSEGDAIAEIETDKVTMELEAEDEGTLAQLIADEGQDVPVGEAIAFIEGEGEEVPNAARGGGEEEAEEGGEEDGGGAQATATETEAPEEEETEEAGGRGRRQGRRALQGLSHSPQAGQRERPRPRQDRRLRSRRPHRGARRAGRHGERNGPEDGRRGAGRRRGAPEQAQQAEMQGFQPARLPEPTEEPGTQLVEPTRMMQVIGERMTEAKQHVPHFYATVEVRMDAAMALRKQLNAQLEGRGHKALRQRLRDEGVRRRPQELPQPQRPVHHPWRRVAREGGHGHGRGPRPGA